MKVTLPGGGPNVTGICDRIDEGKDGELMIVDYKTGKAPNLKYSDAVNQRIMNDKFFQLKVCIYRYVRAFRSVNLHAKRLTCRRRSCLMMPIQQKQTDICHALERAEATSTNPTQAHLPRRSQCLDHEHPTIRCGRS